MESLIVKYHSNKSVSGFVKTPDTCRVIEFLLFQLDHKTINIEHFTIPRQCFVIPV